MNSAIKAQKIRAVILDIDGVLTDSRVGYDATGNEIKFFHTRDGHGLKLALRAGLLVGVLSGRSCEANRRRVKELGLSFALEGCLDKTSGFDQILAEQHLQAEQCLYIGDDVVDAPPMQKAGIGVVVADGVPELDKVADFRTVNRGGFGAVREVIDWLLKEQGKYETVTARYFEQ